MHGCFFDVCVRRGGCRSGLVGQNMETCACDGWIEDGVLVVCVVVVVMGLGLSVSWTIVVLCLMLYGRYLTLMITVLDYCMLAAGRQGASPSLLGQGTAMQ